MSDFSIPGVLIGKVLQGAVGRVREHQENDWKTEEKKRDRYIQQLSALIPTAATGADIEAINEEIARVVSEPREKPFKPRLLKTPSFAPPKVQSGAGGAGSQAATPPPFDFREVMAAITGQGPQRSGQPDVPSAQGGPPEQISAVPPELAALLGGGGGGGAGNAAVVPPVGAGLLGATGAPTPPSVAAAPAPNMALTPPAMPLGMSMPTQVATPPGRNVPEPSPLVGTLPGTPSPVAAGAGAATPPALASTPTPTPTPAPLAAVPPSPFMGIRERAELPYQLNEQYGMNRSGKPIGAQANKPLVTVKDIVAAAKDGLEIVADQSSPSGFSAVPRAANELSLRQQADLAKIGSQLETDIARRRSMSVRDKLATERPELMRELASMRASAADTRADRMDQRRGLRDTMFVAGKYEKSIGAFREMSRSLSQLEALINEKTGPGDYGAIIQFVHSLDDTAAREGEVAMARSAASLANRFEQLLLRWREGDMFADEVRKEFIAAARASNEAFQEHRKEIDQQYGYVADVNGLDRRMIGVPGGSAANSSNQPATPPSAAPSAGKPRMSRQERNKRTGATRTTYSDDGGATWHP